MIVTRIVIFVIFLILILIFAYSNLSLVEVNFFGFKFNSPLFLILLVTTGLGFALAYGYTELKGSGLARYSKRLRNALINIGTGRFSKAEDDLNKLTSREEILPIYSEVLREQGKSITLYYDKYSLGIAETVVAESIYKEDIERAIDLLEKALGKNPENLRAKRMLRSLYFIKGEIDKAIDLQRDLIRESLKEDRKKEERVLTEMIACSGNGKEPESKTGWLCYYLSQISGSNGKRAKKVFSRALSEGLGNEVLRLAQERGVLSPDILSFVTENEDRFYPSILGLLYLQVGRVDRLEDLKENLPEPIKLLIEEGEQIRGECFKEILGMIRVWKCQNCGAELSNYTPVCENCLHWNTLRIKGGI